MRVESGREKERLTLQGMHYEDGQLKISSCRVTKSRSHVFELRVLTNTLTIKHPTNADLFAVPYSFGPLGNLALAAGGVRYHNTFGLRFPDHGAVEVE